MNTDHKSLLVRADFLLGAEVGGERLVYRRWRRVLRDALPALLGCAQRHPRVRVRLHDGTPEGSFTAWLRFPIERRPGRKRLRKLRARLRSRLEAGLLPIAGRVIKLGVRRCRPRLAVPPAVPELPVAVPSAA